VKVAGMAHPAMLDPSDAAGIRIPFVMIASGDEKKEDMKGFAGNLKAEKIVEIWGDQRHGFMAARYSSLKLNVVRDTY
jgi:hypothetical protein